MATWTDIPDSNFDPGQPIRSVDGLALRDNVTALAERASGAPWLNGIGAIEIITASGNWIAPAGVTRVEVTIIGGGGGGGAGAGNTGSAGGSSTGFSITANGGGGGIAAGGGGSGGAGGGGGSGGISITGEPGFSAAVNNALAYGGGTPFGFGGHPGFTTGQNYGGGGSGAAGGGGGGGGETRIAVVNVVPGDSYSITIGAGGSSTVSNGANGVVILRY